MERSLQPSLLESFIQSTNNYGGISWEEGLSSCHWPADPVRACQGPVDSNNRPPPPGTAGSSFPNTEGQPEPTARKPAPDDPVIATGRFMCDTAGGPGHQPRPLVAWSSPQGVERDVNSRRGRHRHLATTIIRRKNGWRTLGAVLAPSAAHLWPVRQI